MRVYATPTEYAAWLGLDTAPAGADGALRTASLRVDQLLIASVYDTDIDGYPADTVKRQAVRDATCAQAAAARSAGDSTGTGVSVYSSVSAGSVSLSKDSRAPAPGTPTATSSDAYAILQQAGLVPAAPDTTGRVRA